MEIWKVSREEVEERRGRSGESVEGRDGEGRREKERERKREGEEERGDEEKQRICACICLLSAVVLSAVCCLLRA